MKKRIKGKPIKEKVFATRNKEVILFSKIFGPDKTNEILKKTFSNDKVVSKLLNAEKFGFELLYGTKDEDKGVILSKQITKPGIDIQKYKEKYWKTVRANLKKIYDEETTDAIIEHYNPPGILNILISGLVRKEDEDNPTPEVVGVNIEFDTDTVLGNNNSDIEKDAGNKIVKYKVNNEEILSVFIDCHLQVFGNIKGIPSVSNDYCIQLCE